ncbi:hypothetical protein QAD02_015802 [Eretmocerus hayati]|uniref:Uncharacterized protein n=1 Tax=Eretmocerus hayati TaxID=131215 RepID=A0ACC2P9C3_9HYME|nr:hypothetical protein QAD02_015802 [Eretmocerus hayati]
MDMEKITSSGSLHEYRVTRSELSTRSQRFGLGNTNQKRNFNISCLESLKKIKSALLSGPEDLGEKKLRSCRRRRSCRSDCRSPSSDNSKSSIVVLYRSRRKPSWSGSSGSCAQTLGTPKSYVWTSPTSSVAKVDRSVLFEYPSPESTGGHHSRTENFEPNLEVLAQNFTERHPKGMGDNNLAPLSTSELQRVFPFQATPSGNLKIVPNQVVFESKKVSVLVAEPRHAKVNVKAEQVGRLNHAISGATSSGGIQANNSPGVTNSKQQPPRQPMTIDLPPGVTTSTVDRLQAQRKLPAVQHQPELAAGELGARPRTQPFNRARTPSQQLGQQSGQQQLQQMAEDRHGNGGAHREPIINDVPLSSLGFTTEQPIDWNNVTLPEKTDLYRELSRRITQYKNADCIIRIGNDEFHCHLLVLQSYSSFFDDRNIKDMDLTGSTVTSRAFSIIYDWMISTTSESCHLLRRDNILEIFLAAQYLGIKELEEQCWAFIDNDELFCEDTAFLLYLEARKIGNTAVMELMVPRIMKFFLMLVSTKDFLELAVEELCLLLRSNYICVNSEMEILMSAVRWLMYDWESRKQYMIEVMKCVRFGLIAPWQLVDVKRNPENPEFMELMSYPEIQKMVDDGLAFVIIKYWYGNQTEDYYHWIDLLGLSEPTNRNWAGEDKHYVTYREFLLYLEEYQRTKVLDFKNKKLHKPSPPPSPPKEELTPQATPPQRPRIYNQNTKIADVSPGGPNSRMPMQPANMAGAGNSRHMPPCMMMPPEILSQYLSDMNKKINQDHKVQINPSHAGRLSGGAEQPSKIRKANLEQKGDKKGKSRGRLSEESDHRSRSTRMQLSLPSTSEHSSRKLQSIKCLYKRNGSLKSVEEAATTIQAMYRGYKTRKRLEEVWVLFLFNFSSTETVKLITLELSTSSEQQSKNEGHYKNVANPSKTEQISETKILQNIEKYQVDDARSDGDDSTDLSIKTIMPPAFVDTNDDLTVTSSREISPSDNISLTSENNHIVEHAQTPTHDVKEIENLVRSTSESQSTEASNKPRPSKIPHCELLAMVGLNKTAKKKFSSAQKSPGIQEVILVFGGIDPHTKYGRKGSSGKDMYCYRPDENRWTFVGEMPEPRHHHSVVAYLTGRVYLAGKCDELSSRALWNYI